jgi:hypothetical protein
MKRAAFIVSTGRTGTVALTQIINDRVANAWSLHEPKPAFRRRARRILREGHTKQDALYFLSTRRSRQALRSEPWYIECNHNIFSCLPMLRSVYPDAVIVNVIRDGREVVTSWLNRYSYIRTLDVTPMDHPGDPAAAQWKGWNPLQKTAWFWVTVNDVIEAAGPDHTLRFEELFHESGRGLEQLLSLFEGVRFERAELQAALTRKHNASTRSFIPPYEQWPAIWKQQFAEIAGEAMARHGYPL